MSRRQWRYVERLANASRYWQGTLWAAVWAAIGIPAPRRSAEARSQILAGVGGAPVGFVSGITFARGIPFDPTQLLEAAHPAAAPNLGLYGLINIGTFDGTNRTTLARSNGTVWVLVDAVYIGDLAAVLAMPAWGPQPLVASPFSQASYSLAVDTTEGVLYIGGEDVAAVAPDPLMRAILPGFVEPSLILAVDGGLQVSNSPGAQGWTLIQVAGGTVVDTPVQFDLTAAGAGSSAGYSFPTTTGANGTYLQLDGFTVAAGGPPAGECARIQVFHDDGGGNFGSVALVLDETTFGNLNWHLVDPTAAQAPIDTGESGGTTQSIELMFGDLGAFGTVWFARNQIPAAQFTNLAAVGAPANEALVQITQNGTGVTAVGLGGRIIRPT